LVGTAYYLASKSADSSSLPLQVPCFAPDMDYVVSDCAVRSAGDHLMFGHLLVKTRTQESDAPLPTVMCDVSRVAYPFVVNTWLPVLAETGCVGLEVPERDAGVTRVQG
jgi:hypothetical protein